MDERSQITSIIYVYIDILYKLKLNLEGILYSGLLHPFKEPINALFDAPGIRECGICMCICNFGQENIWQKVRAYYEYTIVPTDAMLRRAYVRERCETI